MGYLDYYVPQLRRRGTLEKPEEDWRGGANELAVGSDV